jgi:uncharacterized protein (TIGR02466 family)
MAYGSSYQKTMIVHDLHALPVAIFDSLNLVKDKDLNKLHKLQFKDVIGSQSKVSFSNSVLDSFKSLKKQFDHYANIYATDVLKIKNTIYMSHSWVTFGNQAGGHPPHIHKGCLFSISYYVYGNGKLYLNFIRSRLNEAMNFPYDLIENNNYNSDCNFFETKPSRMIIFPSWIQHSSNEFDGDRLMIGANYFVKGTIGTSSKQVDKINL